MAQRPRQVRHEYVTTDEQLLFLLLERRKGTLRRHRCRHVSTNFALQVLHFSFEGDNQQLILRHNDSQSVVIHEVVAGLLGACDTSHMHSTTTISRFHHYPSVLTRAHEQQPQTPEQRPHTSTMMQYKPQSSRTCRLREVNRGTQPVQISEM
jgi:hypothetical protein